MTPTEPPSALSSLPPPSRPASENNNSRGAAETALVLHHDAEREESRLKVGHSTGDKAGKRDRDGEIDQPPAPKKKPSLVAAMRPRTSSQPLKSPANADAKGSAKTKRTLDRVRESSPVLVPRANATSADKVEVEVAVQAEKERKGKEREESPALEEEDNAPVPVKAKAASGARAAKARSVLREKEMENAFESDEEAEHMERLEARRQRRLAKALIVKDRTETAATKGATAASKLKASKSRSKKEKRKRKDAGSDDDDSDASEDEERESKRRRKVSAAESNKLVQNTKKAANVSGTRLTMKPAVKLGLFHKGAASTRIKIGQKLPDLAFSELNFLNAPRPSPPRSTSSSHSSSSSHSTASHANAKPSRKRAPLPAAVVITYGKKKTGRHASRYFEEPDQPDQPDQPSPPRAPSPKKSKSKGRAPPPKSSSPPPPPPRKPTTAENNPPAKTKQRRIPSPSPPPPPPPPAVSDSGHSAHSLAGAAAEQKRKHASPPPAEREPSETFLDTSGMPWTVPAPRAASLRVPSPAPARNATASPSAVGSGSDSHLDRLIKACLDGHLPGSDPPQNKHQDGLDAPDDDESSFLSVRDPRPSDLHRWPTDIHFEQEGRESSPQHPGPDHYRDTYRDGDDPRDSHLRDFDVRGSHEDDDNAGDWAEEDPISFEPRNLRDGPSSLPSFIDDREPRWEYGAPSLFGRDDAGESGSWRSDSRRAGGGGESRWSEQRETWPTAGPSTSHFRPANGMDVRPARVPYAFEFDASLSRLHQLGQEGERHTPGADSPAFREAMGSWWHRARP